MAAEQYWWFDSLGTTDAKQILPVLGGMISFGNSELAARRNERRQVGLDVIEDDKQLSEETSVSPSVSSPPRHSPQSNQSRAFTTSTNTYKGSSPQSSKLPLSPAPPRPPRIRPAVIPTQSRSPPPSPPRGNGGPPSSHLESIASAEEISKAKSKSKSVSSLAVRVMRIGAVLFIPIASQVPAVSSSYRSQVFSDNEDRVWCYTG